ncbi:hypothetical protein [Rickettsia sp. TH2014]|uniref:hypothetical protein n=1 Tax=Rickettsia sp. TH2014 TaxID=1967503 RepID=UPI001C443C93|nr:hypothetical protein [Rickettsia sp. TH2014]
MKLYKLVTILMSTIILSGCATIFSGTTQDIHGKVIDNKNNATLENVICTVSDGTGGSYALQNNPGIVKVRRTSGAVLVDCKKEGYKQLNIAVGDNFNSVTLINVLFWPGFIVDALSGSYKKYPSHYLVAMENIAPCAK